MRRIVLLIISAVVVVLGLVGPAGASPATVSSGTSGETCINYVHQEQFGRVEVDLRWDPNTAAYTTLSIWWILNDYTQRPGVYNWTHNVNGTPIRGPESQTKDDAMHTVLRKVENGKTNWSYGDTYKLIGDHPGPDGNLYVAITNLCTIVRR